MFDWLKDVIVGGVAAFFGGILSLVFGYGYWTRLNKRVDKGESEVKHLRDDNLAKLEKKVEDHIKNDKSQQILTEVKNQTGMLSKVGDKVDNLAVETGKQGAQIVANGKYIENLDKSFQHHKTEKHQK